MAAVAGAAAAVGETDVGARETFVNIAISRGSNEIGCFSSIAKGINSTVGYSRLKVGVVELII